MKFRDDIDPANTWVVSDTHFGHDNIVGFCHRPEDHEQVMIAEWRKEVPDEPGVTVLHLGDLAYRSNARFKNLIAPELTPSTSLRNRTKTEGARKLLIQGNHDDQRYSFYKQSGFQIVRPFAINWGSGRDRKVISFSHYPWSTYEDGPMAPHDVRIHGHIHNNGYTRETHVPFLKGHINISVEQTKYKPVNLETLLKAALLGEYEETSQASLEEARQRREERKSEAS